MGLCAGKFIDRYVFSNGEQPRVSLVICNLSVAGLDLADTKPRRCHHALTIAAWSSAFERKQAALSALARERLARIWGVCLAGCACALTHRWVNLYGLLAFRPTAEPHGLRSPLPMARDDKHRDESPPAPAPVH